MKIVFASLIFLFSHYAFPSFAQAYPLPTIGAQWNVLIDDPNSGGFCTAIYKYEKDTFVCGYNYSVISLQNPAQCNWVTPILLRTSGNLIYGRSMNCTVNEHLFYNFGLNVGDTFIVALNLFDTAIVTNVSFPTMLNGQARKFITLKSTNTFLSWQYEWIEGIGDIIKGLLSQYNPLDPVFTLLCFQDSSGLVYKESSWNTCDTTTAGVNESNFFSYSFIIYPNPSFEVIDIKYDVSVSSRRTKIVIYDIMGQLIKIFNIESPSGAITIDKNNLSDGLYLCSLKINGINVVTQKFIIHSTK